MPAVHVPRTRGPWTPPSFGVAKPTSGPVPQQVSGLAAWFEADAGTSTTTDGAAISQWNDQSGNAHHAVQASGVSQPLYKTAIQNGLPGILFDGSNDFMDAAGIVATQPNTSFVVVKSLVVTTGHNPIDGVSARQGVSLGGAGGTNWGAFAGADVESSTAGDTNPHVLSCTFNGASTELRLDGTLLTLSGSPGTSGLNGLRIGSFNGTIGNWNGYVFEIVVYSVALSTADRQTVESYLSNKWFGPASSSSFVLTASDSVTFAESTAATLGSVRAPADSITFNESLARTVSDTRAVTDSVTFAESVARTAAHPRAVTDSVTFSEGLARTALGFTRTSTDSLTFSESLARTKASPRTSTDSITFSESVASGRSISRTATDSVTFAESLARTSLGLTRTSTDSLTFAEALTRGALGNTRAITDTLTFSESIVSGRSISRTVTDSIGFAESLARTGAHPRTQTDTLTFAESVARTQALTPRTAADSITFSESVASGRSISRTSTDSVSFSESLARTIGRPRTASDNFTLTDALTRGAQTFTARAGVDSVTFAEVLSSTASTEPSTRWVMGPSGRWSGSAGNRWPGDTSPRWDGTTGTRWPPSSSTRWS
jgi:hypothetical protein